jgi:hypothetical protein
MQHHKHDTSNHDIEAETTSELKPRKTAPSGRGIPPRDLSVHFTEHLVTLRSWSERMVPLNDLLTE